ncbi:Asp-tRNA(Asn)/Glu-tRNA(Gln) amidotransferase subunit GatA [Ruminococcaceae bacterium OttesenSCG-928-N02]|nr:Asp-tRNA(Asn)/Glu-tRNA(Gln) amidotransferase subunit GatA [Ruminococcaceae bacterium OttesenSCG-928-N02]
MNLHELSAIEIAALVKGKEISATQVVKETTARIREVEPVVDAFLNISEEQALAAAALVDAKIAAGEEVGPLAGVPVAVKDNICTKGTPTTCASKMLEGFVSPYDATVIEKLQEAGAIIIGKTNMDEFAMGSTTTTSYFKPTKNPWDPSRVPGGSSGGSAAAVAARQVAISLGSDTGGSVRQPANFCGILGMKPTYGSISRYGVVAFASSLDQVGAFSRTVDDMALTYSTICGLDKRDATSKKTALTGYGNSVKGLRLAIPKEYFGDGISADVKQAVYKAVEDLKALGAEIVEISLPSTDYALAAYYIISSAEASSNFGRFDGVRYGYSDGHGANINQLYEVSRSKGFGDEVKRRIILGTYVLSASHFDAYYKRAKATQKMISAEFQEAFASCDAIITPITPTTAFKIGENENDPAAVYAGDICTVTLNIAGLPGISVPCGFGANNMPVGFQIIGPKFSEGRLLTIAKTYEQAQGGFAVKEL